jgi:NADH dehydrogenase
MLKRDNVVSEQAVHEHRTFEAFGIKPTLMEAVLPSYLWRYRKAGQYSNGFAS